MKKDKLDILLEEYDSRHPRGNFEKVSDFKERFFEAARQGRPIKSKRRKPLILAVSALAAAAAMIIFVFMPLTLVNEAPRKRIFQCAQRLMKKIKKVFPERNVGLCLIDGELKTFERKSKKPRSILVSYFVKRLSDGKEINISIAASSNNSSELNSTKAKGSIWVFQPDNEVVSVDTDLALKLDSKTKVKIQKSNLLEFDKKEFVSEFEYKGSKYQLFQAACKI